MANKTRWFIVLSIALIIVITGGIYLNYRMDQVVKIINRPGVLFSDTSPSMPPADMDAGDSETDTENPGAIVPGQSSADRVRPLPEKHSPSAPAKVGQDDIVKGVQQKVSRPVEKKDLFKAGLIIIRKLSWSEIEYMYDVGAKDSISAAELKEVHRILRSRLSSEEIKVMQELGRKYGKNLDFLSASKL